MTLSEIHQELLSHAKRLVAASSKPKLVYGRDLLDFPADQPILTSVKLPLTPEGTIEISTTTPAARPAFEWLAEITVKEPENIEHFLLRPDETIVETYGKNVYDVTPARAQQLLLRLSSLS